MNRPIDIRTRQLKCEVSPRFTRGDALVLTYGAYAAAIAGVVVSLLS
jgi:hypothetical protein